MDALEVGLQARVRIAHAVVESLARSQDIDLLHLKGPALDASLTGGERQSSDADVLVRPIHVDRLTSLLPRHGWRLVTGFERGSAFAHAANYHHEHWGYVDLHRSYPGLTVGAAAAFDALWGDRGRTSLAHVGCPVPSLLDQRLLLVLHAARDRQSSRGVDDVRRAWYDHGPDDQQRLRERARQLGAQVALAAAIGELDLHAGDRSADLWRFYSQGGTRLAELRARVRAAPDTRTRMRVLAAGLRVNPEYVAMVLGHEPSAAELAEARRERRRRALHEVRQVLRGLLPRRSR